jgi:hypothetical protein
MSPAGVHQRFSRAAGQAGAIMLGLWLAWKFAPKLTASLDASAARKASASQFTYRNDVLVSQFASYVIALASVVLATLGAALLFRFAKSKPWLGLWLALVLAVSPLACALSQSTSTLQLALFVQLGFTLLLVPHTGPGLRSLLATSESHLASFVLGVHALCLGYGTYLALASTSATLFAVVPLGAACFVAGSVRDERAIRAAIAGAPLLSLPLLALTRNPSLLWVLVSVLVSVLAYAWLHRRGAASVLPEWLSSIAAPTALAAIPLLPLGLRELPTLNHEEHEAFHLAWINSVLHGKYLWADAGLVHGPLRDYAIVLYLKLTRIDLAHVRIAFVMVNAIGIALALPFVWRLARRNLLLLLLGLYLLLMQSPARTILWYRHMLSLGWADLSRTSLPVLALWLVVVSLERRHAKAYLVSAGALFGVSLLYSQEFALCGILGAFSALVCESIRDTQVDAVTRARRGLARIGVFLLAMLAPVALVLVPYLVRGKAMLLVRTAYESVAFPASGAWGSLPFPLTSATLVDPAALLKEFAAPEKHYDSPIVFLLPVVVYVVTAGALALRLALRKWNLHASELLAVWVFGVLSYRVTVATPDVWHLLSSTTPAILLLVALTADVASLRIPWRLLSRRVWLPVGKLTLAGVAALALVFGEYPTGVVRRMSEVSVGFEKPSSGASHASAGLPRAGDVHVPDGDRQVLEYIQKETLPSDAIFVSHGMFSGSELYFLANRRNPSRFDTLSEVVTVARQRELLASLQADPPALVVGSEQAWVGREVTAFFAESYELPQRVGGYLVRKRKR